MEIRRYLDILHLAEQMKNNVRHSWTSSGRRESVAEHTFRLILMAYFVKDEFQEADMEKVMKMCLFHDFGEAFTGDIPTFEKDGTDEEREQKAVNGWIETLPEPYRMELRELFSEMEERTTLEAKIYRALDKMEALIQHNEAEIQTWLPLEYTLQMTYGEREVQFSDYMKRLKAMVNEDSRRKIEEAKANE